MLIFDNFSSMENARAFAMYVRDEFNRGTRVCNSQEESNQYDPFPFLLHPPIVLVQRDHGSGSVEDKIETMVNHFSGEFAGT